jgi:hypothetical protein
VGSENDLQHSVLKLQTVLKINNMNILEGKSNSVAVTGKRLLTVKILINNKHIEQVKDFIYSGSDISVFEYKKDIERNIVKYSRLNGILKRNF